MEEDKLELYEKYGLSLVLMLMFATIGVFITINYYLYNWNITFAFLMLLPMIFCAYLSQYWEKQIKSKMCKK